MPSVATSSDVAALKLRSNRTCQPDFAAERPALFVRDAARDRARGHAARLEHEHGTVGDQRRRHARGLARARRRRDDRRASGTYRRANRVQRRIDRQWDQFRHR